MLLNKHASPYRFHTIESSCHQCHVFTPKYRSHYFFQLVFHFEEHTWRFQKAVSFTWKYNQSWFLTTCISLWRISLEILKKLFITRFQINKILKKNKVCQALLIYHNISFRAHETWLLVKCWNNTHFTNIYFGPQGCSMKWKVSLLDLREKQKKSRTWIISVISARHCCLERNSVDKVSSAASVGRLSIGTFKAVAINNRICKVY